MSPFVRAAILIAGSALLGACSVGERLAQVGEVPPLTRVQNPVEQPGYQPVVMPMPAPRMPTSEANSLWRPGSRAFLKDQRASEVGDILTVMIEIDDSAAISNTTARNRANSESLDGSAFLGVEGNVSRFLPDSVDPSNLVDLDSASKSLGNGTVDRDEKINLKVAALVTQVLPNANLVILGRQEVRVNFEVRELQIAGVIRPEDIRSDNSISYEKIAEARIAYGGRGQITDVQQPRYGQQVFDILAPF